MATVLTDEGVKIVTHRLKGDAGWNEPVYLGWGSGAGTAAKTDTALFTEESEDRVVCATDVVTDLISDDTWQAVGTMTADAAKTITNVGLFDSSDKVDANDRLFIKGDFNGVQLLTGDSIQFTIKWRLNN